MLKMMVSAGVIEKVIVSILLVGTVTTTASTLEDELCVTTGDSCVNSCDGLQDGDYQSCRGCHIYSTCDSGELYDIRLCATGLLWNDVNKTCDWESKSCKPCRAELCINTGPGCIRSCAGLPNGNYQSCRGCHVFASCANLALYDRRPCPYKLVWNDITKKCDWKSPTCKSCRDCNSNWTLVYENNQDGAAVYGTLDDLRDTLHSGGLVRVYFPGLDSASEVSRLHMVTPDHVCAELSKRIRYRKSVDGSAESDAYWALAMACTSGHFEELRKYVGTRQSEATGVTHTGARWYVKYHSMTSMALHDPAKLRMLVANGYPVHGVAADRKHTDVIPLQTVAKACSTCVFGQAVDAVDLRNCSGNLCEFQLPESFWVSQQMTPAGHIRTTSRKIDDFSGATASDRDEKIDWFADTCWRLVYTQDSSGQVVSGNRTDLFDAIQHGHRVRVQLSALDGITAEADVIRVREGEVTALLLHLVTDEGSKTPNGVNISAEDQTYRAWFMISTTGDVKIRRVNMASTPPTQHLDNVIDSEVRWFVDTRPWARALATNASDNATVGGTTQLVSAVRSGAAVRFLVTRGDNDTELLSALYLMVRDGVVIAENSFSVCTVPVVHAGVAFCDNPSWRFTRVTSEGDYTEDDWSYCGHERLGGNSTTYDVDWFVSY